MGCLTVKAKWSKQQRRLLLAQALLRGEEDWAGLGWEVPQN